MVIGRNTFGTLQETFQRHIPYDKFDNFVTTHIEVLAEYITTKPKTKCIVPWEAIAVKEKSILNKRNPNNANVQKLKKAQREVTQTYQKEKLEYIEGQINKIRNSVEDRQSKLAWQILNEESKKKKPIESKTKSCQTRRKTSTSEKNISRICLKPFWNH